MPTVLTIFGLRVVIYLNDHRPAHVHVLGNGCEAVFDLRCPRGPLELRENFGFMQKELGRIAVELVNETEHLCTKWRAIHGHF
ncbi:DUF4160 domain-containing protein [Oxalobacteraceae bacterium]|nr:DUF4160 domain-containing protein [Oxalobacteraceae bacterium]